MGKTLDVQNEANLGTLTVTQSDVVLYDKPVPVGATLVIETGAEPKADDVVVLWDDEREAVTLLRCGPDSRAHRPAYVVAVVRQVSYSPRAA